MAGFFSKLDDFVNDEIPGGWYTVAALAGGGAYGGGFGGFGGAESLAGAEGAAGSTGFSFLPSGEMTVFSPEATGGTSFLSNLAPMGADYSRAVEMYPTSSGNIFEPAGMSPTDIAGIQSMGDMSLLGSKTSPRGMPNFGGQMQQQNQQELAQLNQGMESGGMKKGQQIPQAILSSLLNPATAVKAYRPTLI